MAYTHFCHPTFFLSKKAKNGRQYVILSNSIELAFDKITQLSSDETTFGLLMLAGGLGSDRPSRHSDRPRRRERRPRARHSSEAKHLAVVFVLIPRTFIPHHEPFLQSDGTLATTQTAAGTLCTISPQFLSRQSGFLNTPIRRTLKIKTGECWPNHLKCVILRRFVLPGSGLGLACDGELSENLI